VKPMPQEKMLLILDGHGLHTLSLAAIEVPSKAEIVTLRHPSHSTHRMQPLDVTFFKIFCTHMASATATKLRDCRQNILRHW
jgi:hypothetical protein